MPETPASIITLNFDQQGLNDTKTGAKELEGIFGRIGGTFERIGKSLAGLAGVAGIGQIVHQFMRVEQSATRTALAVNNITGGGAFTKSFAGAQAATGIDAVDIAGGVRASQQFAGGRGLYSAGASGRYGTYLGHMAQATGLDATTLGTLLGQGLGISGDRFSETGAQRLMSQAYTAAARAGQGGFSGDLLQALTGLVRQTGLYGRGANRGQMAAFMGASMKGDAAFSDPASAAAAIGNVTGVIQGSLGDPRMMAALQMSGASIHDILRGDPRAAQRLAKFARSQGKLPSDLFFFSRFGQEGGRLMSDLADGKITPQQFQREMRQHQGDAAGDLRKRAAAGEDTAIAQLKKLEGTVLKDVSGPLKHIEHMLENILGIPHAAALGAGIYGGIKIGKHLLRRSAKKTLEQGAEDVGKGIAERGGAGAIAKGLRFGSKILGGPGTLLQEMLFPDKWFRDLTHGNLSDGDWTVGEGRSIAKKLNHMSPSQARKFLKKRIQSYEFDGKHDVTDQELKMVELLTQMLQRLDKIAGGAHNQGASFMPGNAMGGAASGNMMAAFVAGGAGGSLAGVTSLFPGGVGALGSGGSSGAQNASYTPQGGTGRKTGGGWSPCVLTYYKPSLGGTNAYKDGKHYANGDRVNENADMVCAAPAQYAFGTVIEFALGGKTVKCVVKDRGSAINGQHFDLIWHAAQLLGLDVLGKAPAQFRVVSQGQGKRKGGGQQGTDGAAPGAQRASLGGQSGGAGGGGGGDFGGMTIGGGFPQGTGGGTTTINVNLDNRRIEQARHRTRAM
jgi:hypothetical protein